MSESKKAVELGEAIHQAFVKELCSKDTWDDWIEVVKKSKDVIDISPSAAMNCLTGQSIGPLEDGCYYDIDFISKIQADAIAAYCDEDVKATMELYEKENGEKGMKIVDCREKALEVDFEDVSPGRIFEYDGVVLIKTEILIGHNTNAIDTQGRQFMLPKDIRVTLLKAHMVIEGTYHTEDSK